MLSLHDEALYAERALRAGARGYIMKRAPIPELLVAIRKVLGGDIYLSEKMGSVVVRQALGSEPLSPAVIPWNSSAIGNWKYSNFSARDTVRVTSRNNLA